MISALFGVISSDIQQISDMHQISNNRSERLMARELICALIG